MNILDATIMHIISQLSFKSLKVGRLLEPCASEDLRKISISDWQAYLEDGKNLNNKPWSQQLKEKLSGCSSIVMKELKTIIESYKLGIKYLSICDPRYPYLLKQTNDPPLGLFYIGNLSILENPTIAIVGARKAATDALQEAQQLAELLANEGASIISGGAMGIDTAAHLGTLLSTEDIAPAISVQAGSLDQLYPKCNQYLFNQILGKGGLFLSERLLGSRPRPIDFPIRNRVISGISNRVILMQAALRSGAISTANLALRQGRDVMVYDPQRSDVRFQGSFSLIEQGAPWFSSAVDYFQSKWD